MAQEPEAPNRLVTTQKDLGTCRVLVEESSERTWTPEERQFVLGFLGGVDEILQELALFEEPLDDLSAILDSVTGVGPSGEGEPPKDLRAILDSPVTVIVPRRDD